VTSTLINLRYSNRVGAHFTECMNAYCLLTCC